MRDSQPPAVAPGRVHVQAAALQVLFTLAYALRSEIEPFARDLAAAALSCLRRDQDAGPLKLPSLKVCEYGGSV
jgi:hypothetical protein